MSNFAYNPDLDRCAKSWAVQLKAFYQKIFKEAAQKANDETITGDWTFVENITIPDSNIETVMLADDSVTDAKLRDSVAMSVIGNYTGATASPADIAAGADGNVLRRAGASIGFGQMDLANGAAVTGVLPVARGGTNQSAYIIPRLLYTGNGTDIGNAAGGGDTTGQTISWTGSSIYTADGDALEFDFTNQWTAVVDANKRMRFQFNSATSGVVTIYDSGLVGIVSTATLFRLTLWRVSSTQIRYRSELISNGAAAVMASASITIALGDTFTIRTMLNGGTASGVLSRYLRVFYDPKTP